MIKADRDWSEGRRAPATPEIVRGGGPGGSVGLGANAGGFRRSCSDDVTALGIPAGGGIALPADVPAAAHLRAALPRDGERQPGARPADRHDPAAHAGGASELYEVGCVGRIAEVDALPDGRFDIVLEGLTRFHIVRELDVTTPFRQVEAELEGAREDEVLALGERASLEIESRRFADMQGYAVDWEAVSRLDDEALVNGIAQIARSTWPRNRPAGGRFACRPRGADGAADAVLRPPRATRRGDAAGRSTRGCSSGWRARLRGGRCGTMPSGGNCERGGGAGLSGAGAACRCCWPNKLASETEPGWSGPPGRSHRHPLEQLGHVAALAARLAMKARLRGGSLSTAARPNRRIAAGALPGMPNSRVRPSVAAATMKVSRPAPALIAREQLRIAQVQPQAAALDEHFDERRHVAEAHVDALARDRMDAVRRVADQREPIAGDPRGMVEAERIAEARAQPAPGGRGSRPSCAPPRRSQARSDSFVIAGA